MKARTMMCSDVAACRFDDTMADAARIMWERDCGIVPVVDAERRVVGVVTDRDLCMAALTRGKALAEMRVGDAMQAPVHCCRPTDPRPAIHAMMREYRVRRIPVVDAEDRLAGMITLNDLVLAAADSEGETRTHSMHDVAETLAIVSRHRQPAVV